MVTDDLREPTLLLLTALTAGPRHGYALMEAVAELSGGRVRLRPGSLYGSLERLADEGLVRASGTETVAGRQRRYYELTEPGADVLEAQAQRLHALAATAGLRTRRAQPRVDPGPAQPGWVGGRA